MNFAKLGALVIAGGIGCWAGNAGAATISIGVSTDGVTVTPVATGTGSATLSTPVTVGGITFSNVQANGQGVVLPPLTLDALTFDVTSSNLGGDGYLFVTETGLTAPLSTQTFITGFTVLTLNGPLTATVQTYFDPNTAPFSTANLLTSPALTNSTVCGPGTGVACVAQFSTSGGFDITQPYTLTEVLRITATGSAQSNEDIDIAAVPGPIVGAGLPGLLAACGGLLALGRRRRTRAA